MIWHNKAKNNPQKTVLQEAKALRTNINSEFERKKTRSQLKSESVFL